MCLEHYILTLRSALNCLLTHLVRHSHPSCADAQTVPESAVKPCETCSENFLEVHVYSSAGKSLKAANACSTFRKPAQEKAREETVQVRAQQPHKDGTTSCCGGSFRGSSGMRRPYCNLSADDSQHPAGHQIKALGNPVAFA